MHRFILKMKNVTFLMVLFYSTSSAKYCCPKNSSCTCTSSSVAPQEYQVFCPKNKSTGAGFNMTIQSTKCINVECRSSSDWIGFLMDNKCGWTHVERLVLSDCELPSAEFVGQPFGEGRVQILKVEGLKGRVSQQRLEVFPGVKVLELSDNFLGKVDADLLYAQRSLIKLDLRATKIQIPSTFFIKSSFLKHLDLSDNDLRTLEPGLFDGLYNLRTLNLSRNKFDFLQPKLFRGLSSLGYLDLSESHLYALPNDIFRDTVNLTSVNLYGNQFISIPENLFSHDLDKLKFVRLSHNKLNVTELPSRLFGNLSSLRVVSFAGLHLHRLSEDVFHNSFNVADLDLSENELEILPVDLLRDACELRKFNASSNKLRALPDRFFVRANKLMKLDLSKNHIKTLDRRFSDGLQALLEINLEDNELCYLHADAFFSLRHLKIAKLARNRLDFRGYFPDKLSPIQHCTRLEELDLHDNEIAEIFVDWTRSHDRLRKLNLSHNKLSHVAMEQLEFSSTHLSLDLSNNSIAIIELSVSYLRRQSRDITINLNGNPIDCFCEVYPLQYYAANASAFTHVKLLLDDIACRNPSSLRGTPLSKLNDTKLECLSKLCVPEGTCDCWILPANKTLFVDCSRRNLTEAPAWIGTWDDLEVSLDLSGNALTRTPRMKSNGYDRVRSLNLADNCIASIDEDLVSPTLRDLHLERNNLTSIDAKLTESLTKSVNTLWLGGNPWLCDNTTSAFRRFVQDHKFATIADYREVVCADDSQRLLWQKPLDMFDLSDLVARGVGALLLVAAMLFLFVASLVYVLFGFLHVAAAADEKFRHEYDALVSFCDDDRDFASGELARRLETGSRPYKLCVRGRDWSWRSTDDITSVVEKSSRVIVVLSRGFFDYRMSCLEYETARDAGSRMIFVVRGDVDDRVSVLLRTMTRRDRCIRWGDRCFWEKLYAAMATRR